MKAIIIARVSTEEQIEAGNSLPAQVERLRNYCNRKKFEIVETFSFGESAYKEDRIEFDKILQLINSSKENIAVCFDRVDRLSRNIFDKRVATLYEKATEGKIELHFASDGQIINSSMSASDKFRFGMNLGLAKYYSDAISDNVKRAAEQKRRNGEWPGKPPIGYINVELPNEKRGIIPDAASSHLIQELFQLWSTGNYSITTVWEKITDMGLKSKSGNRLSRSNIELILKDTFYYGIAYSPKYDLYFPHVHGALITRALFEKCQKVFQERSRKPSKLGSKKTYIFQGLLPCANCSCLYSPETHKGHNYYSCANGKRICQKIYVNERDLLKPIQRIFDAFAEVPTEVHERLVSELRTTNEAQVAYHQKEMSRIRREQDILQKRKDKLTDLLLDGNIEKEGYDTKLDGIKDQQLRLNIEAEEHLKGDHEYHIHVSTVLSLSRRMGDIFGSSEPEEKRQILNLLLQNPSVSGKKLEFTLRKPFDSILELAQYPTGLPR